MLSKWHTGVKKGNGVLLRKCTGCYKGNVANKSHGLSIQVTIVRLLNAFRFISYAQQQGLFCSISTKIIHQKFFWMQRNLVSTNKMQTKYHYVYFTQALSIPVTKIRNYERYKLQKCNSPVNYLSLKLCRLVTKLTFYFESFRKNGLQILVAPITK